MGIILISHSPSIAGMDLGIYAFKYLSRILETTGLLCGRGGVSATRHLF